MTVPREIMEPPAATSSATSVSSSVTSTRPKKKRKSRRKQNQIQLPSRWIQFSMQTVVHIFCLALYLIPIFQPNPYGGPTLDELHIMSNDNQDIQGESSLQQIFSNDYWGRPMQSESSHKSWRPLTVLSFRYLKGYYNTYQLQTHRVVNVLAHAASAEVVGILATRLFPACQYPLILRLATKLVFSLHPTHVEVTANAANRNHIFAVLCSTILSDPLGNMVVFGLALIVGFLCSETFLFQLPAAIVTMIVIAHQQSKYRQQQQQQQKKEDAPPQRNTILELILSAISLLPRILLMVLAIGVYLGGRQYFDTLSIPEGLIRPAENPFFQFEGEHRVRNYLYVLGLHISKSWGADPVGFSHEYGFDCIPALDDWSDPRLALPAGIGMALLASLILAFSFPRTLLGVTAVHWAWLITLFPICGLVKVGTFVSDRIVVASTVSVSLWIGYALYYWITTAVHVLPGKPLQGMVVGWLLVFSYLRVHNRTLQWMDSISLLQSSLVTCPRFAKGHMELSKTYSGLYPDLTDLDKARWHLNTALEIDPDLCDLHQQFAHVAVQQGKYMEYEEELTQAVLCPFTMGGALEMWKRYWEVTINNAQAVMDDVTEIQERQKYYKRIIQEAIEKEKEKEIEKKRTSRKNHRHHWPDGSKETNN
jgi:heme/copper-type cytochrome/quinol oxidase subunit 2